MGARGGGDRGSTQEDEYWWMEKLKNEVWILVWERKKILADKSGKYEGLGRIERESGKTVIILFGYGGWGFVGGGGGRPVGGAIELPDGKPALSPQGEKIGFFNFTN